MRLRQNRLRAELCRLVDVFQNIPRLTTQFVANRVERRETDGASLARFQNRQVGGRDVYPFCQFAESDFAFGHHVCQFNLHCHRLWFLWVVFALTFTRKIIINIRKSQIAGCILLATGYKKSCNPNGLQAGWATKIRTWNDRTKICCVTVTP